VDVHAVEVELRSVPSMRTLAIHSVVTRDELIAWWRGALGEALVVHRVAFVSRARKDVQRARDTLPLMSASRDTSGEAEERYFELLRQRTPKEKAVILAGLVSSVRRLALAGERDAHPELSQRALEARVAARLYGIDVARRFFPDVHIE
jgi:hypothetical protein